MTSTRHENRVPRVVMVMPAFPKLSETFLINKFAGLVESGLDVHIVCGRSEAREWRHFPHIASNHELRRRVHRAWPHEPRWLAALLWPLVFVLTVIAQPRTTWRYLRSVTRRLGWRALSAIYLDANLIRLKPDIVHFEFGTLARGRTYLRDALSAKITVSFRGFDLNFAGLDDPSYYADVWREVDGVHCLGRDLWHRAQRRGCPPDMPHVLIPPAIDVERFCSQERERGDLPTDRLRPLRILSVGRLHWKKGYEYTLLAASRLRDAGVPFELRIVGDGDFQESVSFTIHDLGLDEMVTLVGPAPQQRVLDELRWADVFLHSAVSEGFCNSVLEAQAMRLPVVTTNADGLSENVDDGVTGFVVPRRDPQAMADKLAILAADERLRAKMGVAGRQRVTEHYRLEQQLQRFLEWYRELYRPARTRQTFHGSLTMIEPSAPSEVSNAGH